MNRKLIRPSLTISLVMVLSAPIASHADFVTNNLDVNDAAADDLTYVRLGNSNFASGGSCYENGNLEWFTDGSCFGNSHEMILTSSGSLGIGVSTPLNQLHLASESPGIRLTDEGDQTWDLEGDDDFKIRLNGDPILVIEDDGSDVGNIGFNVLNPEAPLHIRRFDDTQEFLFLESENGVNQDRAMMYLSNGGGIRFEFANNVLGTAWRFQAATGNQDRFEIAKVGTGAIELALDGAGNLEIQGTLTEMSDRNAKERIQMLSGHEVLERLRGVSVAEWSYIDTPDARHVGPMAQDFHAAFGLGVDETKISPRDMAGVNMAAIKALQSHNEHLTAEVAELRVLLRHTLETLADAGLTDSRHTASR